MGRPGPGVLADPGVPAGLLRRRGGDQGRRLTPGRSSPGSPSGPGGGRCGPRSSTASWRCSRRRGGSATASRRRSRPPCWPSSARRASCTSKKGSAAAPSPGSTDWELASRLSYFLWSSMPDQRLFDLAAPGHAPPSPRSSGPRSGGCWPTRRPPAFAESFPRQWLQLRKVGMFAPDRTLYPEYDEYLEKSMVAETTGVLPRGAGPQRRPPRVPRLRLDDAQRAPGDALRHRRREGRGDAAGGPHARATTGAACSRRPRS